MTVDALVILIVATMEHTVESGNPVSVTVTRNGVEDLRVLHRHPAELTGNWRGRRGRLVCPSHFPVEAWPCPEAQSIARRYGTELESGQV